MLLIMHNLYLMCVTNYAQPLPHVTNYAQPLPHVTNYAQPLPHVTNYAQPLPRVCHYSQASNLQRVPSPSPYLSSHAVSIA